MLSVAVLLQSTHHSGSALQASQPLCLCGSASLSLPRCLRARSTGTTASLRRCTSIHLLAPLLLSSAAVSVREWSTDLGAPLSISAAVTSCATGDMLRRVWYRPLSVGWPAVSARLKLSPLPSYPRALLVAAELRHSPSRALCSAPPVRCFATAGGGDAGSRSSRHAAGSSYRRRASSSSSASSEPPPRASTSPSLFLALFRSLPSAARLRLLWGGGLLLAVGGGLVLLFVAALPYLVLPLAALWLARRIYRRWTPHSSTQPAASSSLRGSSSSSSSSSFPFPFPSSAPLSSSPWSALLSSPLSFLSSLSFSSELSSASSAVDAAISAAVSHRRVQSVLRAGGAQQAEEEEEEEEEGVEVEVVSQQVEAVAGRVSGAVVLFVSSARCGGVQLDVSFERAAAAGHGSDGSGADAVRLTRLLMRRRDSDTVEELAVDEEASTKAPSAADVIDVQYEVTSTQQKQQGNRRT